MIDYIRYTIDGKTFNLKHYGDRTWSKEATAPSVAGRYDIKIEISENGIVTYLDSSDIRYKTYLKVIESTERQVFLENYLPPIIRNMNEFQLICKIENIEFDEVYSNIKKIGNDMFIQSASNDSILRIEKFLDIKGQGDLLQRKSYLLSLMKKGKKLDEQKIKDIANTITGSDCIVEFFSGDEISNPEQGIGLLRVQILSPDGNRDYRYEDIERALKLIVPGHIKLTIVKYFSLWKDVSVNFSDWEAVKTFSTWRTLQNYIPPM